MLSEARERILEHNKQARVFLYGQDYNSRSYAVAASDLLIKGYTQGESRVVRGDTLLDDPFDDLQFDYLLANPPFGVDWKAQQPTLAKRGRFGPYTGKLPRINDGALLFLLYMIGKFQPYDLKKKLHGTRVAIVFNGSPLFTGGAGSGESEIRRWIIENDWLEAIVALPEQMFYNTGIGTYVWIVTNRKEKHRQGMIQLIDVRERWAPMRRSLGDKRRELTPDIIDAVTQEHGACAETATSKIFDNTHFGYRRVTIERPLRLRFQITKDAKERFLDAYPGFLDALKAMEKQLGKDAHLDWNAVWPQAEAIAEDNDIRWTAAQRKAFRQCFAEADPAAEPVVAKRGVAFAGDVDALFPDQTAHTKLDMVALLHLLGQHPDPAAKKGKCRTYEPDSALRDFENIPLQEEVLDFVQREVLPFVPDAWIDATATDEQDGGIGKVGYEINFNREFFRYQPPRQLKDIDRELKDAEGKILELLSEVAS
jgi:type I restriction enzyme M protein